MVPALCSQIHDMHKMVLSSPVLPIELNKLPLKGRNSPYFLNRFLRTRLLLGGGCSNSVSDDYIWSHWPFHDPLRGGIDGIDDGEIPSSALSVSSLAVRPTGTPCPA